MEIEKNHCVLVTGTRGFIGQAVCKLLQREGYSVVAVDCRRDEQDAPGREIRCDISATAQVERVFAAERVDALVHLAAILPTAAQRDPLRATQVNVGGSLNLLEAACRYGVRRMVFGSSLSIYGSCVAEECVDEMRPAAPEDLYGAAKLYVERLGEAYQRRCGLEFVGLRIGRVVGAGAQSATSAWRSAIFETLAARAPMELCLPFVGTERILLVHVEDVARMLSLLLRAPRLSHTTYNAPCESVVVSELKRVVESLNSNVRVTLGKEEAVGNPRRLDARRFEKEFGFQTVPMFEQLRRAAGSIRGG